MAYENIPVNGGSASPAPQDPRYTTAPYGQGRMGRTDLPTWMLPKEITGDIFAKVQEDASLLSLGQQVRVSMGENVMRGGGTDPEAGQVGVGTAFQDREGHAKPISGFAFGEEKSFSPIKLATIVTVSDEFVTVNPEGLYSELAPKLSAAVGRAAELAVFHNKSALTGGALVGTATNGSVVGGLSATHKLTLDPALNLYEQILEGYELVVEDESKNFDFTGFASHPQFRAKLARIRDEQGNQVLTSGGGSSLSLTQGPINLRAQLGELMGLPVAFGKAVSGKIGNNADSGIRLIGGDFSQFAYGFADGIKLKVSDQTVVRGVSMWETNQVAILAECTFGWYVNDADAFVAWSNAAESPAV